jgi:2-polyprenyl-3-methyl-5-hydroxy-6-metoxy-1,4-benzoquinol methylase
MTAAPGASQVRAEVRAYYESVGWSQIGEGLYQNARYEDLRPVSREYIQRCHRRVGRHLEVSGRLLLDAGSGPIQYPEYLEYSRGYRHRVCLDISRRALVEARRRIGEHGWFVLGDLAALPFRARAFDGLVSLHALHHVPAEEQETALGEFVRVTAPAGMAAVVYSWGDRSGLMAFFRPLIRLASILQRWIAGWRQASAPAPSAASEALAARGSHTFKHDHAWMTAALARLGGGEIRVWRSVSTAFTRSLIHRPLFGGPVLRLLFALEERAPHWIGRHGMYPLILLHGRQTS